MDLHFLRHAKAVPRTGRFLRRDHERALTPEGEEKMWVMAKGIQHLSVTFDAVFTSPYLRCRQTADIVAQIFKLTSKTQATEALAPDGNPQALLAELNRQRSSLGSVLLVGHEPYLSELISVLAAGDRRLRLILKKGGLARLSTEALRYGQCASLEWLLTPRQLVLLAKV